MKNKKNTIRLTESELKRMIVESAKNIISELDWKTYANAAKKSEKFVDDNWDSDFRDGDKLAVDKDLWKRREKYYRRRDSIDKFLNMADKKHVEKYPDMNGIGGYPSRVDYALKNGSEAPRYGYFGDELRNDEMQRAQDEVMDFYNGNYKYTKDKGWHLPESIVSKAINESFKSIIKEQNDQT